MSELSENNRVMINYHRQMPTGIRSHQKALHLSVLPMSRLLWQEANLGLCVPLPLESTKCRPPPIHPLDFYQSRRQQIWGLIQHTHSPTPPSNQLASTCHVDLNQPTTRCQCSSRRAPFFKCCWAAAISWLAGKSVMTCSRTQPPGRILVFELEKLHLRLTTTPLSLLWAPKLSGFWRSSCLFVPPMPAISFVLLWPIQGIWSEIITQDGCPSTSGVYRLTLVELLSLFQSKMLILSFRSRLKVIEVLGYRTCNRSTREPQGGQHQV